MVYKRKVDIILDHKMIVSSVYVSSPYYSDLETVLQISAIFMLSVVLGIILGETGRIRANAS